MEKISQRVSEVIDLTESLFKTIKSFDKIEENLWKIFIFGHRGVLNPKSLAGSVCVSYAPKN